MTDELEKRVVEAMARAMCIADDCDPDAPVGTDPEENEWVWGIYAPIARKQYRAHLVMQKILQDGVEAPCAAQSPSDATSGP